MMKEELEMIPDNKPPLAMAMVTFISFLLVGFIPISVYVADYIFPLHIDLFLYASIFTFFGFGLIGWLKSYVTQTNQLKSIIETLFLGIIAAVLAYFTGSVLEKIL